MGRTSRVDYAGLVSSREEKTNAISPGISVVRQSAAGRNHPCRCADTLQFATIAGGRLSESHRSRRSRCTRSCREAWLGQSPSRKGARGAECRPRVVLGPWPSLVGRRCQSVAYRAVGRARPRSSATLISELVQERSNLCCAPFLLPQTSLSFSHYTPASRNIYGAG